MVPKENEFNLPETARLPWQGMAKLQMQHFYHYGDTICHPRSVYVTTKLHGTSTADGTVMRYFQTRIFTFTTVAVGGHVNLAVAKHFWF